MTVRNLNLVTPLAHEATAMRTTDTTGTAPCRSGAVSPVIGASLCQSDVDSVNNNSPAPTTLSIRTSTMEIRTITTRTTSCTSGLSANSSATNHAGFLFEDIVTAYFDCRKRKRNSASALAFEVNLERNLIGLFDELTSGSYQPGKSICFVITRPKPREVWAADFRDRIAHHLLYNLVCQRFYAGFIGDSCACIPGRGTLYAAKRLESKIRSTTENWSKQVFYLKLDLANFFVSIDKDILFGLLAKKITEPHLLDLAGKILFHDPRTNYTMQGSPALLALVPPHKRLTNHPANLGLPIGNLSSQFFANVYLNELDQFAKHQMKAKHYSRYVDDFVLLHESPQQLNAWKDQITIFLPSRLKAQINPSKTILQPVDRGVDFVGQVIKPWRRTTRRRVVRQAISRIETSKPTDLFETANSYYGLLRQASHSHGDRVNLTHAVFTHGKSVNRQLTKTYKGATA